MKCANCGAELRVGCVYCSVCGKEAQIVTEHGLLEDDLLTELLSEKEAKEKAKQKAIQLEQQELEKKQQAKKKRLEQEKQKKKKRRLLLLLLLIVCAVFCGIFGWRYQVTHSYAYYFSQAETASQIGDYYKTKAMAEKALLKDPNSVEAHLLMGKAYSQLEDVDDAITEYQTVMSLDPSSQEACTALIELYARNNRYSDLLALMKSVSADLQTLFQDYLIAIPTASEASGDYSDYFTVTLSSQNTEEVDILYTTDGSDPTINGIVYSDAEPIKVNKQGIFLLRAVCADEHGNYSEELSCTYTVTLTAPDTPEISPAGGTFTKPESIHISGSAGTTVYYTWDGKEPDRDSDVYTGSIEVPEGNNVLSVIAIDDNGMKSEVARENFIYYPEDEGSDSDE